MAITPVSWGQEFLDNNDPNFAPSTIWTEDNLKIMRRMNSRCIDLIYLDPPFNSNANYAAPIGSIATGAEFTDTWTLKDVDVTWVELIDRKYIRIKHLLLACESDSMKSYLIYMAVRFIEMRRILKHTGSIYLHCDDTAGAYLKLLMDAVFGRSNCRADIVWKRSDAKNNAIRNFGRTYDTILVYRMSDKFTFNPQYNPLSEKHATREHRYYDKRGRYGRKDLSAHRNGHYFQWKGYTTPKQGYRVTEKRMNELESKGLLHYPPNGTRVYGKKYYSDVKGTILGNLWSDIPQLKGGKESTGYPTQKPLALLERIIKASSNEGDIVFDPFCGCATTLVAADRLRRKWVGCDISEKAAELVVQRIRQDQPKLLHKIRHRTDLPKRSDLGKLRHYRSHKDDLYGKQRGYCKGCQGHFESRHLEVDHIIARDAGGTDHEDNLQLLCSHCNKVKGQRGQEYLITYLQLNQKLLKQTRV